MSDEFSSVRRLHPLPTEQSTSVHADDGTLGLPCKRPTCSELVDRDRLGRPADFCNPSCKQRFHRERRSALRQLRDAIDVAKAYGWDLRKVIAAFEEVEHPTSLDGASPPTDSGADSARIAESADAPHVGGHQATLVALLHQMGIALADLREGQGAEGQHPPRIHAAAERLTKARDSAYISLSQTDP